MHTPFDEEWFARVLATHATSTMASAPGVHDAVAEAEPAGGAVERAQDWGQAPDTTGFVGRADELTLLRRWVLDERCRLVALLGLGGIGKTSLAAELAQDVAPSFERVYWRSLRDAPPVSDWLAGAIGFLSDQQVVPPAAERERLTTLLQLLRERRCLLVLDAGRQASQAGDIPGDDSSGRFFSVHTLDSPSPRKLPTWCCCWQAAVPEMSRVRTLSLTAG
jgi:hypothetical protein